MLNVILLFFIENFKHRYLKSSFQIAQLFLFICVSSFYLAYWLSFTLLIFFCEFVLLRAHLVWECSLTHSSLYGNSAASFAPGLVIVLRGLSSVQRLRRPLQLWSMQGTWCPWGTCSGSFLCEHWNTVFAIHFWPLPSQRPFINVGFLFFYGVWKTDFLTCEQDCSYKCFKNSYPLFLILAVLVCAYTGILAYYLARDLKIHFILDRHFP